MQWGEVSLAWTEQDKERERMDLKGQKDSNKDNDKGLELSGISLTPDLFFPALSKEYGSGMSVCFLHTRINLK